MVPRLTLALGAGHAHVCMQTSLVMTFSVRIMCDDEMLKFLENAVAPEGES